MKELVCSNMALPHELCQCQLEGMLPCAGVHVIMIGAYELQPQPAPYTSTNMLISATQIAWITADLAAVDRTVTPWIVAMFHPRESPLLFQHPFHSH